MKKLYILSLCFGLLGASVFAQETTVKNVNSLLLVEVSLGSSISASEEFVEIYNPSAKSINVAGFALQYKSKAGTSWSNKAQLNGFIAPYGRYLLSNYIPSVSQTFSGGLANGDGHLRIVDALGEEIDLLGWGAAITPETASVAAHGPGGSLKRKTNEDGRFVDTNNNLFDWFESTAPTPEFDEWQEVIPEELPDEPINVEEPVDVVSENPTDTAPSPQPTPQVTAVPKTTHNLTITELMPDPESPLKDSDHEYVEIYNPNSFSVELEDYGIEAGEEWRYHYTIPGYTLKKGEYVALFSIDTNLTLSNSGGQARIVGPGGQVVDEIQYPEAESGMSYALVSGGDWFWTAPSPNAKNNMPVADTVELKPNNGASVLAANDTQSLEKKQFEFATNSTSSLAKQADSTQNPESQKQELNNRVLALAGVVTVLYGIYEYRSDIRVRIQQLRRYLELRSQDRQKT